MNGKLAGTLKGYGFSGTLNEMLYAYYGGTAKTLDQRQFDWLTAKGFTKGSSQDRMKAFLSPYGATSINDLQYRNIAAAFPPLVAYSFWDPTRKSTDVILTDNNQTMASPVQDRSVKSVRTNNSGKRYAEVQMNNPGLHGGVGISDLNQNPDIYVGAGFTIGLDTASNTVINEMTTLGSSGLAPIVALDVIGVAVDYNLFKIWFSRNGVFPSGQDPATNTGGFTFGRMMEALIASAQQNASFKVRTDAPLFTGSIPSGFVAWNS